MEGTEQQIAELYHRLGPAVYRRCLRLLGDRELARDATQEVFMKATQHRHRLQGRESPLPWLYLAASRHCLTLLRDATSRGSKNHVLAVGPSASGEALPDRRLTQQLLRRFDAKTQLIAVGVLVDEMEHDEIADVLGVSRKTVSRKLSRFLVRARKFLGGVE